MAELSAGHASRVDLTISDSVATLTLVREEQLNAFDEAMHVALRHALEKVELNGSVRALILTGSGRGFSAGQDLGERAAAFERGQTPDLRDSLERNYNPLLRQIAGMGIPVIVAVNGIAFGAGAALAIACDVVLAASSARFQFGFVNVGLGPDSGASWALPRLVGQARALDLALTGRPVTAEEALAMGLIARVLPDDELLQAAQAIASDLTHKSPEVVAAIKRQMRNNPDASFDAALDAERDAQALLGQSSHYREAVLHFARTSANRPKGPS